MTIHLMADARTRYLQEFRRQASTGPESYLEPALRNANGTLAREGALQLPLRVDLIRKEGGSSLTVHTPTTRTHEHAPVLVGGVLVSVEAPLWDALTIRLSGCEPPDFTALQSWFRDWFDEDDTHELNDEGFYGVVHFLSDPGEDGSDTLMSVDLGSSPLRAFDQLLTVLANYGPERIEIRGLRGP